MSDRDALLRSPEGGRRNRNWGPQETDQTRGLRTDQVLQVQRDIIQEQDRTLDLLGESIGRIKEIGHAIGRETDEQTVIIDDITAGVDRTNVKIRNTTRQVERVERKASTTVLWIIICVLFLALIGVVVLAFKT
eukprot:TRINITY_DN10768_c0_g1_i1.p2 TRINITY_DN10768_c0_g1~~TRINITY_DN10768_c0_g1_i1.p2  ORF type:complete len:134 (+),score=34.14 TRINITY_DN10768_c0_g1_i1:423-824(+)